MVEEFYTYGRTKALRTAIGFGVVLWPILRNMGQLRDLYPEMWEGYRTNPRLEQYFGAQEVEAQRWLSELIGRRIGALRISTS